MAEPNKPTRGGRASRSKNAKANQDEDKRPEPKTLAGLESAPHQGELRGVPKSSPPPRLGPSAPARASSAPPPPPHRVSPSSPPPAESLVARSSSRPPPPPQASEGAQTAEPASDRELSVNGAPQRPAPIQVKLTPPPPPS